MRWRSSWHDHPPTTVRRKSSTSTPSPSSTTGRPTCCSRSATRSRTSLASHRALFCLSALVRCIVPPSSHVVHLLCLLAHLNKPVDDFLLSFPVHLERFTCCLQFYFEAVFASLVSQRSRVVRTERALTPRGAPQFNLAQAGGDEEKLMLK